MAVPPLIATEPVAPLEQYVGQTVLGSDLNPTDANLQAAGIGALAIMGMGIWLAIRSPKYALPILTGAFGASILGAYVALVRAPPPPIATTYPPSS